MNTNKRESLIRHSAFGIRHLCFFVAITIVPLCGIADEPLYVIPLKPDPPFTVDGDLTDWQAVPNQFVLKDKAHATYSPDKWKGPDDLSAKGWLAWRAGVLYVAVEVTDDVIAQKGRGADMWKGDHIELFLDLNPGHEPARNTWGPGQWQFGFSPGSLKKTGDPLQDFPPEAVCYNPEGHSVKGIQVAARRTPKGYTLETAVPFDLIKLENVSENRELNAELAISDCDSAEPRQEKMMTLSMDNWAPNRTRLRSMLFGNAAGKGTPLPRSVTLGEVKEIKAGGRAEITFIAPAVPAGKEAYVFLKARIRHHKVAGYSTGALKLTLNGTPLDGERFSNRPRTSKTMGGLTETLVISTGEASVYSSPDFEEPDSDPHYGLLGGAKACEFEYRVTDLLNPPAPPQEGGRQGDFSLKPGENTLVIENRSVADKDAARAMVVGDAQLLLKTPPPPPKPRQPAPTGEIPTVVPQKPACASHADREFPKRYEAASENPSTLKVKVGGEQYVIESRFSSPDGQWNSGSNSFYEHNRRIEQKDEAIIVFDTFKNLTKEDVPILQRHTCELKGRMEKTWIAGISPASNIGVAHDPGNPSVFGCTAKTGVGLMAMNDEFQAHVNSSCLDGALGLSDDSLVLKSGGVYTAEWSIVPVAVSDFWAFVNAARRVRDANFTLPYQYVFLRCARNAAGAPLNEEQVKAYLENKSADVVCASNDNPKYEGKCPYSTTFQKVDHSIYAQHFALAKRLVPRVKPILYYHCFLDNWAPNEERFKAERVLKSDGMQTDYGGAYSYDKVFLPTLQNGFGAETARNIDLILGPCGAEGIFWDEMEYSVTEHHYGEPWDGVSGDIDPTTFKLQRKKSSVALLSQEFRAHHIKRILERGPLIANGMPYTRTIARLKFQRFTETGSIANCAKTLLYSPVALGDHLTERTEEDAYRCMLAALDYGCVYNWYSDLIIPTHKTLASYMFPITPMELHEGCILGKERIITKLSGFYGWGDPSSHEVHVFNEKGEEQPDFKTPLVKRNGQTFTELRIAEGWSAAIIRK
ncbi:MAG: hypothetical protein HY360_09365 [Verrucomicrobia bacterium]|nr:hypothetical protein [Verrucomicrobiota bacterium]